MKNLVGYALVIALCVMVAGCGTPMYQAKKATEKAKVAQIKAGCAKAIDDVWAEEIGVVK